MLFTGIKPEDIITRCNDCDKLLLDFAMLCTMRMKQLHNDYLEKREKSNWVMRFLNNNVSLWEFMRSFGAKQIRLTDDYFLIDCNIHFFIPRIFKMLVKGKSIEVQNYDIYFSTHKDAASMGLSRFIPFTALWKFRVNKELFQIFHISNQMRTFLYSHTHFKEIANKAIQNNLEIFMSEKDYEEYLHIEKFTNDIKKILETGESYARTI